MNRELCIDTASSVDEARQLLGENDHAIIISDYQMPGKSGLDLLEGLRESGDQRPFILLTGKGGIEVILEVVNSGTYYLRKRVETASLFVDLNLIVTVIVAESRNMQVNHAVMTKH